MTRTPTAYTVQTPDIKPRTMARLLGLHDPDNGVVVCHPVPPRAGAGHLAHDVLYALGKRPSTPGWPRSPHTIERDVRRWLLPPDKCAGLGGEVEAAGGAFDAD